jgi:N-acetylneuraminic acid mutarotase
MSSLSPDFGNLVYDTESDRVINYLFFTSTSSEYKSLGELLAYDANSDTWINTNASVAPFGHVGARMAYDSESDRIILFGGVSLQTGDLFNETRSYDFNTNTGTKMNPEVSPPARNYHAMAYHPTIDRVVIFGGDVDTFSETYGNDTWEYDYNTDTWEMIETSETPPDRVYSSMVYVSSLDRIIMFGGTSVSMGGTINDMWAYDHEKKTWTELTADTMPGARCQHALAYDSAADKIVLFGGGPDKITPTDETWIYDPQTNTWTDMTPAQE